MQPIFDLRKKYKEEFKEKHEVSLGFMSFFTLAVVFLLLNGPRKEFVSFSFINIMLLHCKALSNKYYFAVDAIFLFNDSNFGSSLVRLCFSNKIILWL